MFWKFFWEEVFQVWGYFSHKKRRHHLADKSFSSSAPTSLVAVKGIQPWTKFQLRAPWPTGASQHRSQGEFMHIGNNFIKDLEPDFLNQREMSHILKSWTCSDILQNWEYYNSMYQWNLIYMGKNQDWDHCGIYKHGHKILSHSSYGKTGIWLLSINLGFMSTWLVEFRGRAPCSFLYPGLKDAGICFLSLGMLTLRNKHHAISYKEAQAAHEETHMRG